MWSLCPLASILSTRFGIGSPANLEQVASRAWEIAPLERAITPPAYFLPGQLERVTHWEFATEHPRRQMMGGIEVVHKATNAFLLKNAWLIDGVLYKDNFSLHLRRRTSQLPVLQAKEELDHAALCSSPAGNLYFAHWLMDDCPTYSLAQHFGQPIAPSAPSWGHLPQYEDRLGMRPWRSNGIHLRQVVVFDDVGQNRSKHRRFSALRRKLAALVPAAPHPGVFILRGRAGVRRVLRNEMEIAERLREQYGFKILDPASADVPTIVAACAGARTIVGVEGSHLIHGILLLAPGGALLTLQPANRFVSVYKDLTDRDGQHFGFVVGPSQGDDFVIAPEEVERTLALFPSGPSLSQRQPLQARCALLL